MAARRPPTGRRPLVVAVAAVALAGCGDDSTSVVRSGTGPSGAPTTAVPGTTTTPDAPTDADRTSPSDARPAVRVARRPPAGFRARCPTPTKSASGCRAVLARVATIQSVDPDGDGDLHVVAVGGSVTGPGLTVFDVRRTLRPTRDPRPGEWVTGAGPVFRGSYGQRQIQVDVFRVWRPRG